MFNIYTSNKLYAYENYVNKIIFLFILFIIIFIVKN